MNLRNHYITSQGKNQSNFEKKGVMRILQAFAVSCAVFALACMLCGCEVQSLSSLRSFAQPYLGEYHCEYAQLGDKNILSSFRSIVLTLEKGGTFSFAATPKIGKKIKAEGNCEYDESTNTLIFRANFRGKECRKDVLWSAGKFTIEHTVAGKPLVMRFSIGAL